MRRLFLFLFPFLLLVGCGGGSSGGGPSFVGTYFGTANFTLSAGGVTNSGQGTIRFVVNANNTVDVFIFSTGTSNGTGPLTGNTFVIIVPGSVLNDAQLTCRGPITFNGTISGNTMTGNFSATLVCNGVQFMLSGRFTATLQPQASLTLPRNSFGQTVRDTLR